MRCFVNFALLVVMLAAFILTKSDSQDVVSLVNEPEMLDLKENKIISELHSFAEDEDKSLVRHKRQFGITCRVGGNAACISRCLLMKRRGGYCRRGTCVCR